MGVGIAEVGTTALGVGLWPRLGVADPDRVRYFEDVYARRNEDDDSLVAGLNTETAEKHRDVQQLRAVSRVVHIKYIAIRVAMVAFVMAACLCVAGVIAG